MNTELELPESIKILGDKIVVNKADGTQVILTEQFVFGEDIEIVEHHGLDVIEVKLSFFTKSVAVHSPSKPDSITHTVVKTY